MEENHEPMLTSGQAAAELGVTRGTVYRWAMEGRLSYQRTLGGRGHLRYYARQVRELKQARTHTIPEED